MLLLCLDGAPLNGEESEKVNTTTNQLLLMVKEVVVLPDNNILLITLDVIM